MIHWLVQCWFCTNQFTVEQETAPWYCPYCEEIVKEDRVIGTVRLQEIERESPPANPGLPGERNH
jgi:hypothetical protein